MMEFIRSFGDVLGIVSVMVGGLIFIWKVSGNLNTTLSNLNGSTKQLDKHLIELEQDVNDNSKQLSNHETRITVLEKLRDKD